MTDSNYGIKATETGVDVDGAPDYRQTINSNWPLVEIEQEEAIDATITTVAFDNFKQIIYTHNLGYRPAYTYIDITGYDGIGTGYPSNNATNDYFTVEVDEQHVYAIGFAATSGTFNLRGLLRIYNYNPQTEFLAPFYQPGDPKSQDSDYGIATLINPYDGYMGDKDVKSIRKFSVTSRAKSLTIHKSGIAVPDGSGVFTLTHNLGYLPSYMIFKVNTISDTMSSHVVAKTQGNQNSLTFTGVQSVLAGDHAYMIFKDPILQTQV